MSVKTTLVSVTHDGHVELEFLGDRIMAGAELDVAEARELRKRLDSAIARAETAARRTARDRAPGGPPDTSPRCQPGGRTVLLRCPDGHDIRGTVEQIPGVALVARAVVAEGGAPLELDYAGETDVGWDGATTVEHCGERVYVCTDGDEFIESALVCVDEVRQ